MKKSILITAAAVLVLVAATFASPTGAEPACDPAPQYVSLLDNAEKWFRSEIPGKSMEDLRLHTRISGNLAGAMIQEREILLGDQVVESERRLYSRDVNGDVFFHGDPDGRMYVEPILWVDAPLVPGKTWTQNAPAYDNGMMPDQRVHYVFACLEENEIVCPKGVFPTYRVYVSTIQPDGETTNCNFWYSETCGLVRCCMENQRVYLMTKYIPGENVDPDVEFEDPLTLLDPLGVTPAPNPANPLTRIEFQLSSDVPVSLVVYDVTGRRVRTLLNSEFLQAGPQSISWRGTDDLGRQLASGQYLFRVRAGDRIETGRVTLIR